MPNSSPSFNRFVIQNELNVELIKALLPLGKRLRDFRYVLDVLFEDAFVFGYKANTTKERWTEQGKKNVLKLLKTLDEIHDLMAKFDWKKRPIITGKDAWNFYNAMMYSTLSNAKYTRETINDLFQISTFYKFVFKNEAPDSYEVADLHFVWQKLDDILFYFNKIKNEGEKAKEEYDKVVNSLALN